MIPEWFLEILAMLMWEKKNISPVCDEAMPNSPLKPRFHQAVQFTTSRNILERSPAQGWMPILLRS